MNRPKPIALASSLILHVCALVVFEWHPGVSVRLATTVHAAPEITWFNGRVTMPRSMPPLSPRTSVEKPLGRTGNGGSRDVSRHEPRPISPTVGPADLPKPAARFVESLDEDSVQASINFGLEYRPGRSGIGGALLEGSFIGNGMELVSVAEPPAAPPPPNPLHDKIESPIRIGGQLQPAVLTKQTFPVYPAAALNRGITGTVVLEATIGEDGKLRDIHVTSGNTLLVPAAVECIKNWRYKPAVLNGEIVPAPATIEVHFTIQRSQLR